MLTYWYQALTNQAFRLFFSLTALYAVLSITVWILVLNGIIAPLAQQMDSISWHLHELIFGVSLAAILGFLFTALPNFLDIPSPPKILVVSLAICWVAARITTALEYPLSSSIFHWLVLLGFAGWAIIPLFKYHQKGHTSFGIAFIALMLMRLGFDYAQFSLQPTLPWLHASLALLMIFIVLALGRISFRIVNLHLQQANSSITFIPKPPMRHICLMMISLFVVSLLIAELHPNLLSLKVLGWISLAVTCAIINLLNDWRIGSVFFKRYPLMIACIYSLMALGFLALGLAYLGLNISTSLGWHLLGIGTLGLSLFSVMAIAGRLHSQRKLTNKAWVNLAIISLILGALARGAANVYPQYYIEFLNLAAVFWLVCFVLYGRYFLPLFSKEDCSK